MTDITANDITANDITANDITANDPAVTSAPAPTAVHLTLLGGFSMTIDGNTLRPGSLGRRDPARLATYLALVPSHRAHREQLLEVLWPDAAFDTVANRLHKAAHYLRKSIGCPDSVVLTGETVALFPTATVEVDAVVFERLAVEAIGGSDRRLAQRAIAMYTGDLLPYDVYEEWAFNPRQRLRSRLRELLRLTGDNHRLISIDPADEDGHIGVMREMLGNGDRSGVLRQFGLLTRVLEQELGVAPSAEARSIRDLALDPIRPWQTVTGPSRGPLRSDEHTARRVLAGTGPAMCYSLPRRVATGRRA